MKLVVLTGAGISAESGIKTFRDSDGLWENYSIDDVCTAEALQKNPELVFDFYNQQINIHLHCRFHLLNVSDNRSYLLPELPDN